MSRQLAFLSFHVEAHIRSACVTVSWYHGSFTTDSRLMYYSCFPVRISRSWPRILDFRFGPILVCTEITCKHVTAYNSEEWFAICHVFPDSIRPWWTGISWWWCACQVQHYAIWHTWTSRARRCKLYAKKICLCQLILETKSNLLLLRWAWMAKLREPVMMITWL